MTRSVPGVVARSTGSLIASPQGGIVTWCAPPKVTAVSVPGTIAAAVRCAATRMRAMASGSLP
ncbi:hypothetical protein [Actinomadura sp. NAK00032]|uniref:hypothetical protein n=1 Tax=Actinomadura sp. NAK00032 TaxID=2742128 RepID=UPI0020C7F3BE|nr:hypothetical protein [Actinomadura sp. NAK00032]